MNSHHNLQKNNKGIGTVFAMVFFLLIVMVVFASFVIVLNQNTGLEQTTTQAKQLDLDRFTELSTVSVANSETAVLNSIVYISCSITNNGTLPTDLVRLWIKDITTNTTGNTLMSPPIIIQPGSNIQYFNFSTVPNSMPNDQFSFWFTTTRGNEISAFPEINQLNGIAPVGTFPGVADINSTYQTNINNPLKLSLNTTKPNQLIYVVVSFDDGNTLYTPTSNPSLTWTLRATSSPTDQNSGDSILKTFYAIKPSSGPITINIQSTADELSDYYCSAMAFAISDVNTATPFDGSAQTSIGRSSTPKDTINTQFTNDFVIGAIGIDDLNPQITPGAGFGQIMNVQSSFGASGADNAMPRSVWSEWAIMGDPRTNLPVNCTFPFNEDWAIIVDAVRLVVVPPTAPMSLSPNSGPCGQPVTVSGQGFAINSQLIATFDGKQVPFSFITDGSGNVPTGATFTVPLGSAAGNHTVTIIDSKFNYASANFTVTIPSMTMNPQIGNVGTTVTVTGSNFISNSLITINFGGNPIATATSDAAGGFSKTFAALGAAGANQVLASDGVNSVSAIFTITPNIVITPTQGPDGTSVVVSLTGYSANSNVNLVFGSSPVSTIPAVIKTDVTGSFSNAVFVVPNSAPGSQTVVATDANGVSDFATFTVLASSISLTPPNGPIGTSVTVSGSNYLPNSPLTVTYDGATVAQGISTGSGSIPSGVSFIVQPSAFGSHAVRVTDGYGNYAQGTFSVSASLSLNTLTGPVGTTVTVTGHGFGALKTVTLTFAGTAIATSPSPITTDATGSFVASITVPAGSATSSVAGSKTIVASDSSSPPNSASGTFTITPLLSLNPTNGNTGTVVTVSGTGYAANSRMTIKFSGTTQTTSPTTVTTSTFGTFSCTFTVPASVAGDHTVTGTDSSSNVATATFTVIPNITLNPTSGNVGSSVTVTGTGFAANSLLSCTFGGSSVTLSGSHTTDASGNLPAGMTFAVPVSVAGAQSVVITDASSNNDFAIFTVNTVVQPITVTLSNSAPSATVTINGGYPSPATFAADGNPHSITMVGGSPFTLSFSNAGNTRDGFIVLSAFSSTSSSYSASTTQVSVTAYQQVLNTFSVSGVSGTDSVALKGTYLGTAGSTIATLNSANGWTASVWSDYNAAVTFPASTTLSSSSERWSIGSAFPTVALISGGNTYSQTYIHQFLQTLSYVVSGGGSPTAPTLTSTQSGVSYTPTLTGSGVGYWLDAGALWGVTNPLGGSGGSQRWQSSQVVSGSVGSAQTVVFTYYSQYMITFGYDDQDSSVITSGGQIGSYVQFGSSVALDSGASHGVTSPVSDWVDAGNSHVSYVTFTSGSGAERWVLSASPFNINVASSTTLSDLAYYHQFKQTLSYGVVGGGAPSAPTATGTALGVAYVPSLTTTATGYWFDALGSVTFSTSVNGANERWAPNPSSISATSANTQVVSMYHQFKQTLSYGVVGGGVPSAPTATGTALGVAYVPTLTNSASPYWFDASGSVTFSTSVGGAGEQWAPKPASVLATASNTQVVSMYHQYQLTASYSTSDASTPSSAVILTGTALGSASAPTLTTSTQQVWFDAGTGWSVNTPITSGTQRWIAASGTSGTVSSAVTVAPLYYHQYQQTFSYVVSGGGSPTAPTLTSTQSGVSYTPTLTGSGVGYWLDAGALWGVTNPLGGSGGSQRWQSSQVVSGSVGSAQTVVFTYYSQYMITFGYDDQDSSVITSGGQIGSYVQFGSSVALDSGASHGVTSPVSDWVDAGNSHVSYVTFTSGSGAERWVLSASPFNINVASSTTLSDLAYYHQFKQTLSYGVVGGGAPSAPTATGTALGVAYVPSLTTTATGYWFDALGSVTFSTSVNGANERWAPNPSSISATSANTQVVSMYHQFKQTLSYGVVGGGVPSAPTATGTALGVAYVPTLTNSASPYWFDASGSVTFSTSVGGAGEQWAPKPASVLATASNTQVVSMYHQYQLTASYSTSDASTPSSAVILTGTALGSASAPTLTTSTQQVWFDAGTGWSVNTPITSGTQRWIAASGTSGTVSSAVTVAPLYYHQYQQTFSYVVSGGGSPTAPTLTSTQSGVSYTPTLTGSGVGYWLDAGALWGVTNPLGGSGGSQRWQSSQVVSGSVGSAQTVVFTYYSQYMITFGYDDQDSSVITSGGQIGSYVQFGSSVALDSGASHGVTSPVSDWVDAGNSHVSYVTFTSGSGAERWVLSASPFNINVASSTTLSDLAYYHQFKQTLSYGVVGGGAPSAPTATGTALGVAYVPSLTTTATGYWFDALGSVTFSTSVNGANERWAPNPSSISATSANTQVVSMYHQFKQTLSYGVVGGGVPSAPTATGTALGVAYVPTLTNSASPYWFDASGSVTFSTSVGGAGEQWAPKPASVLATASNTQVVSMYHQYQLTASYSTSDASTPSSAVILTGTALGSASAPTLTTSTQQVWFDAGTGWSVNTPITSGTQRWIAASGTSGTVSSAVTVAPLYYHQYQQTFSYVVSGGGSPTAPTLTSTQSGVSYTPTLTGSGVGYWLDAGALWGVTNPLGGSGGSQRWQSSQVVSGSVGSAQTVVFTYYSQYWMTLSYSVVGGGSGYSAPSFSANAYGVSSPQTLTGSGVGYWLDAGSWSATNPLGGSSGSEQWTTSTSSGTIASSQTLVLSYNNQYYFTVNSAAGTNPTGQGWYNAGATAASSVSASVNIVGPPSISYTSTGYTGTGDAPPTGLTTSVSFTINIASSVTWTWHGIMTLYPVADVSNGIPTVVGASAHWQAVSDYAAADTAAYVQLTSTGTYTDYYTSQPIGSVTGTINTVTANIKCAQTSGSTGTAQTYLRLGGVSVSGASWTVPTAYTSHSDILSRPGGGSWTMTDIGSLQSGVTLNRVSGSGTTLRCTLVWVVVDFNA